MRVGILTVSDRGSAGLREDGSGPALAEWVRQQGAEVSRTGIIADEESQISETLSDWADEGTFDLILSTGGTGVSPRDVTPEATLAVVDRIIPGLGEAMRLRSLEKTPMAVLSRALAGIRATTLILNLPGSPCAAVENLEAVWDAIPHAAKKIQGDPEECGDRFRKKEA